MSFLRKIFPFIEWAQAYNKNDFKGDLTAGLTVGILLIPQGMAYALIAGLPPVYGLYAALIPIVIYSLMGTSRQLAIGPVAMDSLIVATAVSLMAIPQSEHYIELVIFLALMIGAIQFLLGILRMGFIVNFLSRPVIIGFTSAAALIIGANQIKYIFGADIPRNNRIQDLLSDVFSAIGEIHPLTFIIGSISIIVILLLKKFAKKLPSSLVILILGILGTYLFGLHEQGIKIVETIPSGLPEFSVPQLNENEFWALLPAALVLSMVGFMEAISIGKAIEEKHDYYKIQNNKELIALGLSNMSGSLFSSMPISGSFSRSAVNNENGARTGMAGLISVVVILLTLLFLTDLFYFLPYPVLAAIIIVAVFSLVNIKVPQKLWITDKKEFAMYAITLIATLTVGILEGIVIGVILSLVLLIYKVTTPHMAIVGKFPGTNLYRNVERFEDVDIDPEILILRFDARLFYANINYFKDKLNEFEQEKGDKLKAIIIDGSGINSIDSTSIEVVKRMMKSYKERNILMLFSGLKGPVRDAFKKHEVYEAHGNDIYFVNIENAEKFVKGEEFDAKGSVARQSNV